MNCKKCGSPLNENDQFCKNCGETVNSQNNNYGANQPMNNQGYNQQPMNNQGYNQQPMNNQNNGQPAWANYNNNPMYNNQNMNKSNGNGKYIAIGLAIVVGIIAVIFVIGMVFGGDDESTNYSGGGSTNSGLTNTSSSKKNYKVAFKGFTFEIPDNMVYEDDTDSLTIGDEEGTWAAILEVEQGSFAQLKANKSQLQSVMQQNGYVASVASEKTLGGVEFITLEISASGQKAIAALTKANSMYFIGVTAMNMDNEFDYKLLEKIAPILKSAEFSGSTTNNMSGAFNVDMSGFAELAK